MTSPSSRNAIDLYYIAAGRLNRQFRRLLRRPVCKWREADFQAISNARTGRNSALEQLNGEEYAKIFGGDSAKRRQADREQMNRFEQAQRELASTFHREDVSA